MLRSLGWGPPSAGNSSQNTPCPRLWRCRVWAKDVDFFCCGSNRGSDAVGENISPLAARLFAIDGVEGVFLASNFVTVTKGEALEWADLAQSVVDAIKTHVSAEDDALGPDYEAGDASWVSRYSRTWKAYSRAFLT